jgi:hypothetical protein
MNATIEEEIGVRRGWTKCRYLCTSPTVGFSEESDIWIQDGKIEEFCKESNDAYGPTWHYEPIYMEVKTKNVETCICTGYTLLWFGCTCGAKHD